MCREHKTTKQYAFLSKDRHNGKGSCICKYHLWGGLDFNAACPGQSSAIPRPQRAPVRLPHSLQDGGVCPKSDPEHRLVSVELSTRAQALEDEVAHLGPKCRIPFHGGYFSASRHFTYYLRCATCTTRTHDLVCDFCPSSAEVSTLDYMINAASKCDFWTNPTECSSTTKVGQLLCTGRQHLQNRWHMFWYACARWTALKKENGAVHEDEPDEDLIGWIHLQATHFETCKAIYGAFTDVPGNLTKFTRANWAVGNVPHKLPNMVGGPLLHPPPASVSPALAAAGAAVGVVNVSETIGGCDLTPEDAPSSPPLLPSSGSASGGGDEGAGWHSEDGGDEAGMEAEEEDDHPTPLYVPPGYEESSFMESQQQSVCSDGAPTSTHANFAFFSTKDWSDDVVSGVDCFMEEFHGYYIPELETDGVSVEGGSSSSSDRKRKQCEGTADQLQALSEEFSSVEHSEILAANRQWSLLFLLDAIAVVATRQHARLHWQSMPTLQAVRIAGDYLLFDQQRANAPHLRMFHASPQLQPLLTQLRALAETHNACAAAAAVYVYWQVECTLGLHPQQLQQWKYEVWPAISGHLGYRFRLLTNKLYNRSPKR